jgi:hypothetical protein
MTFERRQQWSNAGISSHKRRFDTKVKVVEWLTRSPAITSKADAFGRAGSNPVLDVFFLVRIVFIYCITIKQASLYVFMGC